MGDLPFTAPQATQPRPVAFLDRDGVILRDTGYNCSPSDCQWVSGAAEAIRLLNRLGYLVVVATNQSGIARGYFTEDAFLEFSAWIAAQLLEQGALIDETVYCPHHPTEGRGKYLCECECRKPKPGMLEQILARTDVRRESSFLIGDRQSDLDAAAAAGLHGFLFRGGNLAEFVGNVLMEMRRQTQAGATSQ